MGNYKTGPGNYKSSYLRTFVKQEDQIVNDSTTLVNVIGLGFPVSINTIYNVVILIFMSSGITPKIKFKLDIPSGATARELGETWAPNDSRTTLDWTTVRSLVGAVGIRTFQLTGYVQNGSVAGNCNFQYAQQVQDASDTKVLKGSMVTVV